MEFKIHYTSDDPVTNRKLIQSLNKYVNELWDQLIEEGILDETPDDHFIKDTE